VIKIDEVWKKNFKERMKKERERMEMWGCCFLYFRNNFVLKEKKIQTSHSFYSIVNTKIQGMMMDIEKNKKVVPFP